MSRKIEDLSPNMQSLYQQFNEAMQDAGIDYIVTCTYRSQAEQDRLYAQGRTAPGKIVTWTRRSRHTSRKAFDICIMVNGKPDWCIDNPDWTRAGEIAESVGLEWGGRWAKPDFPHIGEPC